MVKNEITTFFSSSNKLLYLPILLLPPHTCAATLPSVPSSFHIQWYLITSYTILETASLKSVYTYTTHSSLKDLLHPHPGHTINQTAR